MVNSLYIHIPFCRSKCPYCDFYSIPYQKGIVLEYVNVLCKQIKRLTNNFSTIYIGGGTPTVLEPQLLTRLLKSLAERAANNCEFTLEANPESLNRDKVKLLLDTGVNRISIGVQSLRDNKLKKLHRIHSARLGRQAVILAKKGGFKNISIDLIFGLWQESLRSWQGELKQAINLPVTHISTYALTYEENTPLFKEFKKGNIVSLEDSIVAAMYEFVIDYLPQKGFIHYEISNFAKKGYFCQHNLNYWRNNYYLGLGASAVSFLEGFREKNTPDARDYINKLKRNLSPVVSKERLSRLKRAKETAALKIRTKEGINFKWFKQHSGFDFGRVESRELAKLKGNGLIKYRRKKGQKIGIYLTKKGFLFADTASTALL